MKFLKGLALSLLSFLLFLSLSLFGLAFMLKSTILNPDFIATELAKLNISSLAEEVLNQQQQLPQEVKAALLKTITRLEPQFEEKVSVATHSIYDYLLGKKQNPELAPLLKNTFLNRDFVASVLKEIDIAPLAQGLIGKQLSTQIPKEMQFLAEYLTESLDKVITELEPWIKEQIVAAADPIADYLLGQRQSFTVAIPLEPVKEKLKEQLRQSLLQSPSPLLAMIPQAELERYFDQFYQQFAQQMPSTFEINQSFIGTEAPAQIKQALTEAEAALAQAKQAVGYFHLLYNALIGLMILLTLGIVLINRQIKGTTRQLGTTLLTYGAFEYGGIFLGRYLGEMQLGQLPTVPSALQTWLPQLISDLMAPLQTLSLGCLIGGAVLLIVSFIYKKPETAA